MRTGPAPLGAFGLASLALWAHLAFAADPVPAGGVPAAGSGAAEAAEDDGSRVTYLSLGGAFSRGLGADPLGALYLWRAPASGESRLRALVSVIANEVRYDAGPSGGKGPRVVLSFDSQTFPWAVAEVVDGTEVRGEELEFFQARAGAGLLWRAALGPGESYNGFDAGLTVEAGALWFRRGSETSPDFVLPGDTPEVRVHLRLRADALSRNDLSLPDAGWSAGLDGTWGGRTSWSAWGSPASGLSRDGRTWASVSAYAWAALRVPGLPDRHRLVPSFHAGAGTGLDRFSTFRLGAGRGATSNPSRPVLPGAGVDRRRAVRGRRPRIPVRGPPVLFVQMRGTLALAGGVRTSTLPPLSVGLTSGLPWDSAIELCGSWNFGLENARADAAEKGRAGFLVNVSKVF
jgi:hypothetical protein